ncbi:hypothetical protein AB595_06910 [Massilia sp. WF1]|nr:hypothetical protein AM586_21540 [Massilia sp. WG5]KLU37036.1 hypothetical protein AB595_06910 [Massilia sp. WF1]
MGGRRLFFAALGFCAAASASAADECPLRAPEPLLRPGAYAAQTLSRQDGNEMQETAQLRPGLRIAIRQSSCVDAVTTSLTLQLPRDRRHERTDDEWIDLARAEIGKLRTAAPPGRLSGVGEFLGKAHGLAPRRGERAICRDGTAPASGECSWDSLGGYIFSVRRMRDTTVVSVTEYISA